MSDWKKTFDITSANDLESVKRKYKKLALQKHPNKGGSKENFQKLAAEYELARRYYERSQPSQSQEVPKRPKYNEYIPKYKCTLKFITHEPGEYGIPSTLERVKLEYVPKSVEEVTQLLKTKYRHLVKDGYKLTVKAWNDWAYSAVEERPLENRHLQKDQVIIYVTCRRPRQRRDGFTFFK